MWIHTCFISQHCSIWREVTSLSLDCLTFELFLFPWSSNRLQFLRSVAESMHNTQHVTNMHRLFDSSWSRSSVLETSPACFDSSIRRGVVLLTPRLLGYFNLDSSVFPVYFLGSSLGRSTILETSLTCFDFSIRRNPVPIPCFPLTFSFPLRTQLYIPVQVLLLRMQ